MQAITNPRNYEYSLKNIPIPSQKTYLKCLTDKVENFIRRLRWKAYWFSKKNKKEDDDDEIIQKFGFKTTKTPPTNIHLKAFEDELYEIIRNIEFTNRRTHFQSQLHQDVRNIRSSENVLVFADKSTNLYELSKEQYTKLLKDNITRSYKKADGGVKNDIDQEARRLADRLDLSDKIEIFAEKPAFVTLKDHKEDFRANPKCRLINPAKSEMGHVSKVMLENIVASVSEKTQLNQWRNTASVINWFNDIKHKQHCRFVKFDINEFYPSITEELLDKAIEFARASTDIPDTQLNIIKHSRKSLLFSNSETWIKKDSDLFDVTMGSFDGAEICELVGLYLLDKLSSLTGRENIGLYRDDGLSAIRSSSARRFDKLRKDITEVFKREGLSITIQINLPSTDFLDVTLDLPNGKYYPFRKPNNDPLYINTQSNHPATIIKELPKMIAQRVSDLSCNEDEFNRAKGMYETALKNSGHEPKIEYVQQANKRRRNRKVLWFNPPFSKSVKTDIGRLFLQLIRKHFTRQHPFHSIFNTHTVKLSYSCMPNVQNIIKQSNARIMDQPVTNRDGQCNCVDRDSCPLDGSCLTSCLVYTATITAENSEHVYHGSTEGEFKARYNGHATSLRLRSHEKETELSKFIWNLNDRGVPYTIRWSIAERAHPYKCGTRRCDVCITEKTVIARSRHPGILNKRSEIVSKCRHRNKFRLSSLARK